MTTQLTLTRRHGLEVYYAYVFRDGVLCARAMFMSEHGARQWLATQMRGVT